MVPVPAGPFFMGCNVALDEECSDHEKPQHEVTVPAFLVDVYEVTAAEYAECVRAGACSGDTSGATYWSWCTPGVDGKEQNPANCLDWTQAAAYCLWAGRRLCTAAEWEKAARGGCELYQDCAVETPVYPWGSEPATCKKAVMDDGGSGCGEFGTKPVGTKPDGVSPYGAMDMAGNVSEWVQDCWHFDYNESEEGLYGSPPSDGSAWEGAMCANELRVVRGGSFYYFATNLRASWRETKEVTDSSAMTGFRCCKSGVAE